MNAIKLIAILLIEGGVLALALGSFSYTQDTRISRLGPLYLTIKDERTVNIPVWAGVVAIVVGGVLMAFGSTLG